MIPSQPFECNSKNPFPPSSILSSSSAKPPILSSFPGFIHVPYFPITNNNNKSNTKNITETLFHEDLTIRCSTTPNVERSSSSDTITTTRPRSNNNYFRNDSNINETKENHVSSESSDESSSSSSGHGDSHTEMNQSNNSEPLITPVKTKRRRKKKKGLYCYQSYLDCQRKEKKLRTITENEEQSLLHDLNLIFYPNHSHHDEIMNFPKYPKVNYAQKLVNTTELARIRAKLVVRQRKRSKQINLKDLNEESTNFDLEQFTRNWALSKHSNYFKTHCVNNTTIPSNLLKNSNSSMNDLPTTTTSSNSELVPANNNNTTTSTTNTHQPETISICPQTLPKSKIIPKILPKPLMQSKTASMTSPFTIPQRNRIQNIIGNNKTSTSSYPQGSKIPTNAFPFMPIPSMFQFSSQPSPLTSLARSHHSSPSHYYAFTQPPRPLPSHYVVESQHSYDSTTSQNKEPSTMMATGERMMMHSNITEEEIQSAVLTNYKVNIAVRADIDITTVADHIDHIPSNKDSIMLFTENVNSTESIKISNFREKLLGKELNFNGKVGSIIARLKDESACKRIQLFKELVMKIQEKSTQSTHFSSSHVYFKHIEEDFVVQTNSLLCRCFWPNIDISIYLKQPQFTIVALYNHLVIGFGAVCPQTGYIHYLLTHPHWRNCGIGSFMISYLISQYSKQSSNGNPSNVSQEITIHVPKTDLRVIRFLKKLKFTAKTVHEGFFSQLVTPSDDNDNNAAPTTNILDFLKDKSFDALLMARSFHIVTNK